MKRLLSILCVGVLLCGMSAATAPAWSSASAQTCACGDTCTCTSGDVDGDGKVTTTDARLVLQYSVQKITAEDLTLSNADVDSDGAYTTTDARLILQYTVGKIAAFPNPQCDCGAGEIRNIALNRAVYQSSSANDDNTGHLVTNGILCQTEDAGNPSVTAQYTDSPAGESADYAFDGLTSTKFYTHHTPAWVEYRFADGEARTVTQYAITTANDVIDRDPKTWKLYGVRDGGELVEVASVTNYAFTEDRYTKVTFDVTTPGAYKAYRLHVTAVRGGINLQFAELDLMDAEGHSVITPYVMPHDNSWKSRGGSNEYLYIDLGGESRFDCVKLYWDKTSYATEYEIQVSNDAVKWTTVYTKTGGCGGNEEITFVPVTATYVKLLAKRSAASYFRLFAFEVYGTNRVSVQNEPLPAPEADGTQYLRGGNWRVQRASEVDATGEQLSSAAYTKDDTWLPATVPGTVLVSYLNAGAIPDPYYGDQNNQLSDSFFTADFWYTDSFEIPAERQGQRVFLNFESINWKADVYMNGQSIGDIRGAFIRGRFDVTDLVKYGEENHLAVYIHANETPDTLCFDNPTIEPSAQWDWVKRIRGRDIGLYGDVFLSYAGDVQLIDPWIETHPDLTDFATADLIFHTEVVNTTDKTVTATVKGAITPSGLTYEKQVTVPAGGVAEVAIPLTLQDPELWWPNRYGDQFLYTNETTVEVDGAVSHAKTFLFGVREITYEEDTAEPLKLYVNGVRIYCSGGNWGMDEALLRCNTAEDYDIRIRLHKEENFNMIRNWGGQTYNEEFYNACDKYGILVFDDFWMAAGEWQLGFSGLPNDVDMFVTNAIDKVKFVRRHPSLVLYCGRNEGHVPEPLNTMLQEAVEDYDGTRNYYSSSAHDQLTGWGPYSIQAEGPAYYFQNSKATFHTERGVPNIPALESLRKMMPEEDLWPVGSMWEFHDFYNGNQNADSYLGYIDTMYGASNSIEEFVKKAQMVNYENHKAIFEAPSLVGGQAMLMWMSQSAWPSLVWQSYDYYFDTNAAYFAIKAGNQPVNAVYNAANNTISVVNNCGKDHAGLTLEVNAFDLNGQKINRQRATFDLLCDEVKNGLVGKPVTADMTDTNVNFIQTRVTDSTGAVLCENFYWMTLSSDYKELEEMNEVPLTTSHTVEKRGTTYYLTATVQNPTDTPALMIRVKTLTDVSGEQVLPAYYSDNYFSLMPGESKTITIEFDEKYLSGEAPALFIEGWNVKAAAFGQEIPAYYVGQITFRQSGAVIPFTTSGDISAVATLIATADTTANVTPVITLYDQNGTRLSEAKGAQTLTLKVGESVAVETPPITVPEDGYKDGKFVVKACVYDSAGNPLISEAVLDEWEPTNLAAGKTVTASSVQNDNGKLHTAQNTVDGDLLSRWAPATPTDEWLCVDLGNVTDISKIVLRWETAYAPSYKIEVSTTGNDFTTVIDKTDGKGSVEEHSFAATKARYVRVYLRSNSFPGFGGSLYEVEVYER